MKTIQIHDPPMCCPTGICGTEVDTDLVRFASMLAQLGQQGIRIERHNLAKNPIGFVRNPAVKALLESDGEKALPVIFWDGKVELKGRYPTKSERLLWFRAAKRSVEEVAS